MKVLADNPTGILWQNDGNETIQDSKIPDASKFRVGAPYEQGESGGGGAFSFDVIGGLPPRHDGSAPPKRVEVALFTGGIDNRGGGEVGLSITKPGTWSDIDDAAQQKVAEFRADEVEFKVPIKAPNLTQASGSFLKNGPYEFHLQGDRNLVLYDTSTDPWTVVWNGGTAR